jgi:hypothetical protein
MRLVVRSVFVASLLALVVGVLLVHPDQPQACICSGPAWWCAIYCGIL